MKDIVKWKVIHLNEYDRVLRYTNLDYTTVNLKDFKLSVEAVEKADFIIYTDDKGSKVLKSMYSYTGVIHNN